MWLFCSLALAQSGQDGWKTVETEHFRVHYPEQAEDWALYSAARMEAIRVNTSEAIGYAPDVVIDVVVMDPYSQSNGWAMPSLRRPKMGLYASPPPADSVLGHYRSWSEDLITHEDAHLVHLLRESRHGTADLQRWTIGYGPLARKSERWVAEGYATVIEGRLTGWGRPNSTGRQILLYALASDNEMPAYGDLNLNQRWAGMGYAYLIGSAYLEWLEQVYGEGKLVELWAAMSAKDFRSFEDAFILVFDEHPEVLYDEFVVALTIGEAFDEVFWDAPDPDEVYLSLGGSTGPPALSPDGEWIAVVNRSGRYSKLEVYSTSEDEEARTEWLEAREERLEADPQDVAGTVPHVFAPAPEWTRQRMSRSAVQPRWIDDERILFTSWWTDDGGQVLPDLFEWTLEGGERRVTRGQAVMNADPHPNGDKAVALRTRWGSSQLVEVDLDTGDVTELTEGVVDAVLDAPRYSPDGSKIAYLRNDEEIGWQLMIRSGDRDVRALDLPIGATPTMPTWDESGQAVWVTFGQDLVGVPLDGAAEVRLTRKRGVLAPQIHGDEVFFLSVHADGLDLSRATLEKARPFAFEPIEPPPVLAVAEIEPGAYEPGLPWFTPIPGFSADVRGWNIEGALHAADRAGKYSVLAWFSAGSAGVSPSGQQDDDNGFTGVNVTVSTYVLPVRLQLTGARLADHDQIVGIASLSGMFEERWESGAANIETGVWVDDRRDGRVALFADGEAAHTWWFGPVGAISTGSAAVTRTEGRNLKNGSATVGVTAYDTSLTGTLARSSSQLDDMELAGRRVSMRPSGWGSWYVDAPGLIGGSLAGDHHRMIRGDLMTPASAGLRAEKHVFWNTYGLGPQDISMVSVVLAGEMPQVPMDIRPQVDVDMGAGCTVAGTEVQGTPCSKKEHYRFWFSATWSPRAE
ncbi:MAG: hypothetical protein GY884_20905 [Proteobacteria bacterium]|nr:hypothetical protein [Pseudomonadota bacterium]